MKKILIAGMCVLGMAVGRAQTLPPENGRQNVAPYRTEFITYSTRNLAEKGDRSGETYYIELTRFESDKQTADGRTHYAYEVELPMLWRDRDVFLHVEGMTECSVEVNGRKVGSSRDSRAPSEFFISEYLTDGTNRFKVVASRRTPEPEESIAPPEGAPTVFLYSQPQVRIHDVIIESAPDEEQRHGVLSMQVVISSSRNYPEQISVGYDIYSPDKELKYYDLREIEIGGRTLDTIRFSTNIYGAMSYLWSAGSPKLYDLTVYLKRNRIITEYLPLKVGFGTTSFDENYIYRNGKPIDIKAVRYDAAADAATTRKDIANLRKERVNTLYVSYPQPYWFYDICDEEGIYVVDRANINTDRRGDDRTVGGTLANAPKWREEFVERQKAMYYRSRLHPCIIAWSLGGASGGGYNMYKAYEWFKSVETARPVVYPDGDWNNDLRLPEPLR